MINYNDLKDYDDRYKSDICMAENHAISCILGEFITPTDKVLDLGCGTGFALDICDKITPQNYHGIDSSANMIFKACQKHRTSLFSLLKAERVNYSAEYDVVLSLFSIPYIGIGSAKTIKNALKKDGVAIIVYYDKPYKNPASVYYNNVMEYVFRVKPNVKRIIRGLRMDLTEIINKPLTEDKTYRIAVFMKE